MPTATTTTTRTETQGGTLGKPEWAAVAVVSVSFLMLFYRWFLMQHRFASKNLDDWGHTYMVPLIAGWLAWQERERIARAVSRRYWPGLVPMCTGIMCYLFALVVVPNHMLQGFSVILTLFGVVLLMMGPAVMRPLFLPITYLVFMVTIAERIMLMITFQLQLVASRGSWILLSLIGAPFKWFTTEIEGNTIEMMTRSGGIIPLNVAEACSGMRMVVAFIALAGFVALISTKEWWQRILLMLLAAPVAIFMNIIRVTVLGLLSLADPDLAAGEAHTLIGTLLLFPALMLYLGIVWALNRVIKAEPVAGTKPGAVKKPAKKPTPVVRRWTRPQFVAAIAAALILSGSALGLGGGLKSLSIRLQKEAIYPRDHRPVSAIPVETPSWKRLGSDRVEAADIVDQLGTSNYVNRAFIQKNVPEGEEPAVLELHLAYYTGMIDTVPHVPERCFIGAGMRQSEVASVHDLLMDTSSWVADGSVPERLSGEGDAIYTVRLPSDPAYTDAPGIRLRLPRGVTPDRMPRMRISSFDEGETIGAITAGYFFIANGGTVANAEGVRALAFDLTSEYAFYLKVQVSTLSARSPEKHAQLSASLLGELMGEIMRCVPDWIEVQEGRYPEPRTEPTASADG
ncbi:MAG: exosortase [Phycisphaerales bacterium]|jgi:exosortase